ncbi:MAG: winged helix-turn-helix domain-containing protein [Sedimentisphaerales bacterium]|jgi:hypothetical protein
MSEEKDVTVGMVYSVRSGGGRIWARIEKSLGGGNFNAVTMPGGKAIKVIAENIQGDGKTPEEWAQKHKPKKSESPKDADKIPADTKPSKKNKATKTGKKKERKTSGLDAAARVLRETGKPMRCPDIIKMALEKGYWSTKGATPAATVYSAIIREIANKGNRSRFRKSARGEFELTAFGKDAK